MKKTNSLDAGLRNPGDTAGGVQSNGPASKPSPASKVESAKSAQFDGPYGGKKPQS